MMYEGTATDILLNPKKGPIKLSMRPGQGVFQMRTLRRLKNEQVLYLCSALVLVLAALTPAVTPVYAAGANEGFDLPSNRAEVLPAWWGKVGAGTTTNAALPGWWRLLPKEAAREKGLHLGGAAARPSKARGAFSVAVAPRVGDGGRVDPNPTVDATREWGLLNLVPSVGLPLDRYPFVADTSVTAAPELTLTLGAFPDPVNAGSLLTYQVHYENQGPGHVDGVRITVTYSAHVTYVSASRSPITSTDNVWDIGRVKGGTDGDINILVTVEEYMADLTTLTTSATVNSNEVGPHNASEGTVVHAPVLELAKSAAPDPALANDQLVYTLVYSNVGHADASGLVITDAVPVHTGFARCQPLPCGHNDRIVNWEVGDLTVQAIHTATLLVDVNRNVDSGTALTNTARVWVLDTPVYSATTQITTSVVSSPSLWLTVDNERTSVEAGDRLTYTRTYTNDGGGKAYDVRIVAKPPSSDVAQDPGCVPPKDCVLKDGALIYDVGTVLGGTSDTVNMLVAVRDPLPAGARSITASVIISTVTPGDAPDDNAAKDVDAIATRPDLAVTADYPGLMPWPGKRVTYTVGYNNDGRIATTGVVMTATRHRRTKFNESASHACWKPQDARRYSCALGELDCGDSGERLFVVTLTKYFTRTITDFDTVFAIGDDGGSGEDANPDDNVFWAPLGVPNLVIEDVVVESSVWQGRPGWFTATIRNEGPGWACGNYGSDDYCGSFWLDLYLNIFTLPVSYPRGNPGNCADEVNPIAPGAIATAVISFTGKQEHWYDFGFCGPPRPDENGGPALRNIRLVVDNWDLYSEPQRDDFGLVDEYDEFDNFRLETPPYQVFMPLVYKNYGH